MTENLRPPGEKHTPGPSREKRLKAVDLFCGIGGFHLAARELGIETIFACDIDKAAVKCYSDNFGLEPRGDIRDCKDEIPDHDILMAGFPCQPFSIIGKGVGLSDPRGALIYDVAEIAGKKKPRAIVLENVMRLNSHQGGQTIETIKKLFQRHGYRVESKILNALDFGLPQKRQRTIIVGLRSEYRPITWPNPEKPLPSLSEILEEEVDSRYFANQRIQDNRKEKHTSALAPPAVWHQNISDVVTSHTFALALRANASYNYQLVNGERRFTEREMLRLQGFPEWFQPTGNYQQTRRQTGNAVPVPMIAAALRSVLEAMQ